MSKNKQKAYFGVESFILNLVLWFFLGWILGPIQRLMRGNILGAIVSFFLFFIFVWIDLFTLIVHKDITILA